MVCQTIISFKIFYLLTAIFLAPFVSIYTMDQAGIASLQKQCLRVIIEEFLSERIDNKNDEAEILFWLKNTYSHFPEIEMLLHLHQDNFEGALITAALIDNTNAKTFIEKTLRSITIKYYVMKNSPNCHYDKKYIALCDSFSLIKKLWGIFKEHTNSTDEKIKKELIIIASHYNAYAVVNSLFDGSIAFDNELTLEGCAGHYSTRRSFTLNIPYRWGNPLLEAMEGRGDEKLIKLLLSKKVPVDCLSFDSPINPTERNNGQSLYLMMSPLIFAIKKEKIISCRFFLITTQTSIMKQVLFPKDFVKCIKAQSLKRAGGLETL